MEELTFGQAALDLDEAEGLIPDASTRSELDEYEFANIQEAIRWVYRQRWTSTEILNVSRLVAIHKRMFGRVWRWAGQFRRTEKNIGIPPELISMRLRQHLDDVDSWISNGTYELPEILGRFHHGLVLIHPFPNGNGRHARLVTEAVCRAVGHRLPRWTDQNLVNEGEFRDAYISALQEADRGEFAGLVGFMFG